MNESKPVQTKELNRVFCAFETLEKRFEELFQSCHYFVNEAKYGASPSTLSQVIDKNSQRSRFAEEVNEITDRLDRLSEKADNLSNSIEK